MVDHDEKVAVNSVMVAGSDEGVVVEAHLQVAEAVDYSLVDAVAAVVAVATGRVYNANDVAVAVILEAEQSAY